MKFLKCIPLLLLSLNGLAQIDILITNPGLEKFIVGIDQFQQNPQTLSSILITDLDTGQHIIQFQFTDKNLNFQRSIKLNSAGIYTYIITQNFEGTYQLRYRGSLSTKPKNTPTFKFTRIQGLIVSNTTKQAQVKTGSPNPLPADTISEVIAKPDSVITALNTNTAVSGKIDLTSTMDSVTDQTANNISTDSIIVPKSVFDDLIVSLNNSEYEFNRLNSSRNYLINNPISVEQTKTILRLLKYDNTRLQFLNYAKERLQDPENLKDLLSTFDYELSKEQFKEKFLQ